MPDWLGFQLCRLFRLFQVEPSTQSNKIISFLFFHWTVVSEVADRKRGKRDEYDIQQRFLAGTKLAVMLNAVHSNHSATRTLLNKK